MKEFDSDLQNKILSEIITPCKAGLTFLANAVLDSYINTMSMSGEWLCEHCQTTISDIWGKEKHTDACPVTVARKIMEGKE